jgi:alkylhydroperoxidase/carboxymuconolactone decarboxylase family protein YurZ
VDETLRNASLSEHDRVVVQLGATIAAGAPTAFRDLLDAALDGPLSPTEAKEIVYQAVTYVGSARVGDFLAITNEVLVARRVTLPALFAALGGADAQVQGHVAGNLNVGNTRQQMLDVLTVLVPLIGYPRTLNALAAVDEGAPAA